MAVVHSVNFNLINFIFERLKVNILLLVDNVLRDSFFYNRENQALFWAIRNLVSKGVTNIDVLNLENMLASNKSVYQIIKDYRAMTEIIDELIDVKNKLNDENLSLKEEIRNLNMKVETLKSAEGDNSSSADVLRRLSNLEKIIYGKE